MLHTGIVILNWNNSADTIECIQSILNLSNGSYRIYLVDNGSNDNSVEILDEWCKRNFSKERFLSISLATENASQNFEEIPDRDVDCLFLKLDANLGYAGGNNYGIRAALMQKSDYVWLLNNDTTVEPNSLSCLLDTAKSNQRAGVVGSVILEYDLPYRIQCYGGGYFNWISTKNYYPCQGEDIRNFTCNQGNVVINYISGASMFIPAYVFQEVGLLAEEFFLYYEELDFAERCKKLNYDIVISQHAIVYHKFGSSLGSDLDVRKRSKISVYYGTRGAILIILKYKPFLLPVTLSVRMLSSIFYLLKGRRDLAKAAISGITTALTALFNLR